ncbi:MAG: electron transfer flavoprotein subunit alpha/FixB family protein [Thermoanaerobaculia bacterium]|nr:electron transfer flavoprotein subunit alpha/FixB family protein [Thermoanaerobaculia bacterium]
MAENTIYVVLQHRDGKLHRMSREAIAAAQMLAGTIGGSVEAVLLGSNVGDLADQAAGFDLAAVHVADLPVLESYTPGAYVNVLAPVIREASPAFVVFPHTYQSVDLVARLAQEIDAAYVPEVVSFEASGDDLLWRRPVLGGKLQARVRVKGEGTVFLSVQSGAFRADDAAVAPESGGVAITPLAGTDVSSDRELLGVEQVGGDQVDLSKADVVVAVGRGIGKEENLPIVEELAAALGADIGASRPVIDNGWLPRDRQIGSSGQTVAPKLYVAVGISGAIQHLVGMKGAQCVVSINKDPSAPIFTVSKYGIVGDLHEVVPALTEAIQAARG